MIVEHKDFFNEHWLKVFLNTFERSIDSIVLTSPSPQEHFLYVNEAFKQQTGYVESELIGESPRILQGPKTDRVMLDKLKKTLKEGKDFVGQNINYRKDKTTYIVRWHISALKDSDGKIVAYISYQKETTQLVFAEDKIRLLSSAMNQISQMVVITDLSANIVYANNSFFRKYGYTEDEILGKSVSLLKSGRQSDSFYKDLWNTILSNKSFHGMFINKDNKEKLFFEQKTITPMKSKNGDVNFFVSVAQDITKLVNESKDYKLKAYKDKLTGLYNRLKFDEEIEMKFFEYHINSRLFSIMIIDIDHFKYVNDTFGHDKGDEVLKDLAHVLKDTLRSSDFISRWGGEEFVVIIDSKIELATEIANKIIQAIETKIKIGSHVVTASAGVTQVRYEDTQESLFTRIDAALYESKNNGRNRVISIL